MKLSKKALARQVANDNGGGQQGRERKRAAVDPAPPTWRERANDWIADGIMLLVIAQGFYMVLGSPVAPSAPGASLSDVAGLDIEHRGTR